MEEYENKKLTYVDWMIITIAIMSVIIFAIGYSIYSISKKKDEVAINYNESFKKMDDSVDIVVFNYERQISHLEMKFDLLQKSLDSIKTKEINNKRKYEKSINYNQRNFNNGTINIVIDSILRSKNIR